MTGAPATAPKVPAAKIPGAKVLIVNADDFGLTAGVSRGILEAHTNGIVTSTTLLVNRAIPPAQVEELKDSALGVGVHLNLTLGTPVADPKRVPSLVDAEGRFVRDAREAAARAKADEARIELGTQIDVFRRIMGRFPTHLDTHHHVGRHRMRRYAEPRGLSASGRRTTSWANLVPRPTGPVNACWSTWARCPRASRSS